MKNGKRKRRLSPNILNSSITSSKKELSSYNGKTTTLNSSSSSSSSSIYIPRVLPNYCKNYNYSRVNDDTNLHSNARIFRNLILKKDHKTRPLWVTPNHIIYLESWNKLYSIAYDFLVAVAEPISRPQYIHEYKLTEYSLYGASGVNSYLLYQHGSLIEILGNSRRTIP